MIVCDLMFGPGEAIRRAPTKISSGGCSVGHGFPCLAFPCLAWPCPELLCIALSCSALLCHALPCFVWNHSRSISIMQHTVAQQGAPARGYTKGWLVAIVDFISEGVTIHCLVVTHTHTHTLVSMYFGDLCFLSCCRDSEFEWYDDLCIACAKNSIRRNS
jgi:hypothetical protein